MPADDQQHHPRHHKAPEETKFTAVGRMTALRPIAESVDRAKAAHQKDRQQKKGAEGIEADRAMANRRPRKKGETHFAAAKAGGRPGRPRDCGEHHQSRRKPFPPDRKSRHSEPGHTAESGKRKGKENQIEKHAITFHAG